MRRSSEALEVQRPWRKSRPDDWEISVGMLLADPLLMIPILDSGNEIKYANAPVIMNRASSPP
jgi:hypothetical protein